MAVTRNAGAKYFLPSENEWYKAAFYKGGGTNAGYGLYPTKSDANNPPSNVLSATGTNNANYLQRRLLHRSDEWPHAGRGLCGIARPLWHV